MPRPEKHLFVCTQQRPEGHPRGCCQAKGGAAIAEEFWFQLQGRNLLGRIALTTTACFGPCGIGPNVLVYPDGVLYSGVTRDDVAEIVEQHLQNNQVVGRLQAPADLW
ncbi:MAG TPA: (2Fe-2S) ferredoxin domain-containing protein [Gammaproteobacteria bacterium]